MEDIDIALIKKRSLAGILALTSRTFTLQLIAFAATFLLTMLLSPAVFGLFYVVSAIVAFLNYFSDIGLAAALIQKQEAPSKEDLRTTFTIQQVLVGLLVIVSLLASGQIAAFYGLDAEGLSLLRVLIFAFFLSSLKTIPSVLLERKLNFQLLVIPQILETICFYVVAVILAWRGFGIASFTWAVLSRAMVGTISIYYLSPWPVSFGYSRSVAQKLLKFGIPFQLNSFLALVKDDLLTVFLGKILPFTQIGYIGWAKRWSEIPLRLIMDNVIRITFPTFARLQELGLLKKAIEKTLFGVSLAIFPITIALIFIIAPFVALVPRYQKWEPALLSFYLFAIGAMIASLSTPLTNALNAVGKIKITLGLMVVWTIATWILTFLLVNLIGFNGVALALLLITGSLVVVVRFAKTITDFSLWVSIRAATVAAICQAIWLMFAVGFGEIMWWRLLVGEIVGGILYTALIWKFERERLTQLINSLRQTT